MYWPVPQPPSTFQLSEVQSINVGSDQDQRESYAADREENMWRPVFFDTWYTKYETKKSVPVAISSQDVNLEYCISYKSLRGIWFQ